MTIQEYISEIQKQFATGVAREHTYRPALQQLLSSLLPHLVVSNEPKREDYGVPDYILMRPDTRIPIAFVEAIEIPAELPPRIVLHRISLAIESKRVFWTMIGMMSAIVLLRIITVSLETMKIVKALPKLKFEE